MKTILPFYISLFFLTLTNAQNTFVPDDNFEQALIDLGYDSGALDDFVPTANINAITFLNVNNNAIADLTGIEDFTALTELRCFGNQLTNLDVSQNIALEILNCGSNLLTSLNVNSNTLLEELRCGTNQITQLNLNLNGNLTVLNCSSNNLEALDVSNGNNTNVVTFDASSNPNLFCIQVDDITHSYTNWGNYDAQTEFSEDCHFNDTYVPDDNFEQALIDLGYDSGPLDDYVITNNINTVTSLDIDDKNISDLTGIESFVSLTLLSCNDNNISSIDVSNNTGLIQLFLSNNAISSLDLSSNTSLSSLTLRENQLVSLDLRQQPSFTYLLCQDNQLETLYLNNGNNTSVTGINLTNNPNLYCVQVDDAAYSASNWTIIDPQTSFSENCSIPPGFTFVPDDNFEQALIDLGYDSEPLDDLVPTANIASITVLDVGNENISDLTGIEDFIALENLACDNNNLTSLNVNNNTALVVLECNSNQITSLDISQNTALTQLECYTNQLTSLDVSQNTLLENLQCQINDISSLDVSQNTALTQLVCSENELTNLDVSTNTQLVELVCSYNDLTTLFVGQNTLLEVLKCSFNNLNGLDVSTNTQLNMLIVRANLFASLDVSQNPLLEFLDCRDNLLTNLDVTINNQLTSLYCEDNQLTQLDLSQNTLLEGVYCHNNQLENLDLSLNTALYFLRCEDNELTSLNVKNGNNSNFIIFDASNNPNLTCIEVDDVNYSTTNWPNIDPQTSFSENCGGIDCDDAQTITVSNTINTINFDLTEETLINETICSGNTNDYADTWFEFTMPEDGAIGINGAVTANNFTIYDACGGNELACFNNNGIINGLTSGTTYKLKVFRAAANAGNSNFTSFDIVLGSTLGTDDVSALEDAIKIYPNPASTVVNIKIPSQHVIGTLTVTDLSGKKLLALNNSNSVNVNQLSTGIYFLKISIEDSIITKKLIIRK